LTRKGFPSRKTTVISFVLSGSWSESKERLSSEEEEKQKFFFKKSRRKKRKVTVPVSPFTDFVTRIKGEISS